MTNIKHAKKVKIKEILYKSKNLIILDLDKTKKNDEKYEIREK